MTSNHLLGVDLETTGLNERNPHSRILELGFVVLTEDLDVVDRASWVMPLPASTRDRAEKAAREMHDKTGLWDACATAWDAGIPEGSVHPLLQAVDWVEQRDMMRAPLFGSSVHFDWRWLDKCLPTLTEHRDYHHRDVSAVRSFLTDWAPEIVAGRPAERKLHRVDPDLDDSIAQGRYFREEVLRLRAMQGSSDLIRSLIPQRRQSGDGVEVVDVHGCSWMEDAFGTWASPVCEESPLATRTDIEIAAGPLVEVERA